MEFWNKLIEVLKQKGFSAQQIKRLQEMFGHLNAERLLDLTHDQLLPAMSGRTLQERRKNIELFMAAVRETEPQDAQKSPAGSIFSYLQIMAGGESAPILQGEDNTQSNVGGTDVSEWLECSAFEAMVESGQQGSHGMSQSTGQRVWRPALFVVRIGKSTPWLFDALRMNKRVDLVLHLFNVNEATQMVEQYFQYRIQQGRITSVRLVQSDVIDPATANMPHRVEFSVMPSVAEVESMTGGTVMVDNWSTRGV